jgi:hypothetical protein
LTLVIAQRQRLIDEVDVKPVDDDAIEDLTQPDPEDMPKQGPSTEAMSKLTDYSEQCHLNSLDKSILCGFHDSDTIYQRRTS